ncbi:Rhophilin-2-A, partial [Aphis craccivora]
MAATAVTRAQNRAIAKGTDPKAATCRAKLQRARSALNKQMDRELRLREGAENLLRATTKDGGSGDNSGIVGSGGGRRNKSKSRKLIRQTVALELSFLDSNVRLLADELAELNGSVDVYQYRDDDEDEDNGDNFDGHRCDPAVNGTSADGSMANRRRLRRQRLMPMIAVPLKDTRPIDFGPPLERFISQHYGVDLSATPEEISAVQGGVGDDGDDCDGGTVRRRSLSLREAIDELTQLRVDTQTPSRDLDGVRLLLRYYRQLYYVDRRFFPPAPTAAPVTTTPRNYHQHNRQQQDPNYRHVKQQQLQHSTVVGSLLSSPPPAIYFEWYDSFGGPVPSCGQRTVRFEQACVLFNVAAVHTQMGAKYDRRCRDDADDGDDDDYNMSIGSGKRTGSSSTSTGPEAVDGAAAAAQCFLRAAGAYRHIGDTFANAPARAADLRATGVLYALMMAQAHECAFEKLQWRFLTSVRQRCRRRRYKGYEAREAEDSAEGLGSGDRRGRGDRDTTIGGGNIEVTANTPTWTELAREAAHVSRMYGDVVYNSCCRPTNDRAANRGKENGGEQGGTATTGSMLPDVWVAVCRIKDRHYAALAYRFAACALLPYRGCSADGQPDEQHHVGSSRRRSTVDSDASQLLTELTAAAAAAGLGIVDDDDDDDNNEATSVVVRQRRRRKQLGMLLLEAAAAAHDRADRAQRLCRQLRSKSEGNTSGSGGGGGLLAGVLDRERQRTVRLLLLQRRYQVADDEYGTAEGEGGEGDNDRRVGRAEKNGSQCWDCRDCCSDDDGIDAAAVADFCSGDQEEFTAAGIAGIPGLDVDRGVLIRPRTRFRLMSIAPDFTDTGDGDNYADGDDADGVEDRRRQKHEIADREERRADLFAGLGPVAVFSARHQCSRPRWVKVARGGGRHRSPCGGDEDDCDDGKSADPIQLVDRWFGFELRSHGGGTAAAVPPATVGHVRSSSQAQHVGLRRGDIVVALKLCSGDGGGRAMDVRWETCRRVAELIVYHHQRRLRPSSGDGAVVVQLKVVTPITAATASDIYPTMDPNK